ncbi:MAG: AMP-binding protein [Candidatus Eisenbacteria bacterium]
MTRSGDGLTSEHSLPPFPPNIATMLVENVARFDGHPVFQHAAGGSMRPLSWRRLGNDVILLQAALAARGVGRGDRVAVLSRNRREMLEIELAVMSMGAVSVPIFHGYPAAKAQGLVRFCEPAVVVTADTEQYGKLDSPDEFGAVVVFDPVGEAAGGNVVRFEELLAGGETSGMEIAGTEVAPGAVCLMMYTSGTTGRPKLVQLTHSNILSQQAAMRVLWKLTEKDRFLSYLPWHHSFGGIFEKFAALSNGAVLSLEHGYGKDMDVLLENWMRVRPTCFFSVPRVYQEITSRAAGDREVEKAVFHDELRFIFTAAAPLPKNISDVFEERGIPVYEGWGLTETSPCCTVTDPSIPRDPGVVGKPIPGVSVKLGEDDEILVRGPNVMSGYYRNPVDTERAMLDEGWFATGDVGAITEAGVRLISRKDRIFKLSNAEIVIPTEIENLIVKDCAYLSHAFVAGSGRDYPVVLLFPNRAMFSRVPDGTSVRDACECPEAPRDLAHCLGRCMRRVADSIDAKYARPRAAMLIDHELSIENEELTPSMKLAPGVVARVFKADIESLYGSEDPANEKVYVIRLE